MALEYRALTPASFVSSSFSGMTWSPITGHWSLSLGNYPPPALSQFPWETFTGELPCSRSASCTRLNFPMA